MPDEFEGSVRAFCHTRRAWYAESALDVRRDVKDEVVFGYYDEDPSQGCQAEMSLRWYLLSGRLVPRLEAFDDSWAALARLQDLLAALAARDGAKLSADEFCELLLSLGFVDRTATESPFAVAQ